MKSHPAPDFKHALAGELVERDDSVKGFVICGEKACAVEKPAIDFIEPSLGKARRADSILPVVGHRVRRPPRLVTLLNRGNIHRGDAL